MGLGSNLGDRASYLLQAIRGLLDHRLPVRALSPLYETDPVGYLDQPSFLNMVLAIDATGWDPWRLLTVCQEIETSLGRRRSIPQGPRTIDLDLLFFGQQVVTENRAGLDLVVPHPRLAERAFVLIPLCDLDPALLHPVLGKTVAQLLAAISPQTPSSSRVPSAVRRYALGGGPT
ncbi:MAG: 2-amino-4-hydroxy-6-hydroxymethyldihydropteridine diphosphokinase [Blastocatellia bacterium]